MILPTLLLGVDKNRFSSRALIHIFLNNVRFENVKSSKSVARPTVTRYRLQFTVVVFLILERMNNE